MTREQLAGDYEQVNHTYTGIPGYEREQLDPQYAVAVKTVLLADGTVTGGVTGTWTYQAPWLELKLDDGLPAAKLHVSAERDWENS